MPFVIKRNNQNKRGSGNFRLANRFASIKQARLTGAGLSDVPPWKIMGHTGSHTTHMSITLLAE
jgi:hypothetical protein